jgi:dTDP-4-amino-4,6-dideoxygalactose transaminase
MLYEKLKPVFADVDEFLCLDPVSVAEHITPRTRAVMFVGLGGNTGHLREVVELCRQHNLKLILDAAHMTGTRWLHGGHIGAEADVSIFSFQAVKNLPTADSGMICFMDGKLDVEVRKWTWMGINKDTYSRTVSQGTYKWYYDVEYEGFKYHGNSIMAAMGLVAIKYVDQDNAYRRQISAWYDELLEDEPLVQRIQVAPGCISSRHLYQIMVDRRDEVMLGLNQANIFPGVHYRDNTIYKMYAYAKGTICA